jgi:hypothetical protein
MQSKTLALSASLLLLGGFAVGEAQAQQAGKADGRNHQTEIQANQGAARMVVQTSNAFTSYSSASFVQVTGMAFTVPVNQKGIFVATFTGETSCSGGSWCSVRIVCDSVELLPNSGTDFAFASPGGSTWKSMSMTRRSTVVTGGSHVCEVEAAQVGGSTLGLDDWLFIVEFWRRS